VKGVGRKRKRNEKFEKNENAEKEMSKWQ